MTINYQFGDIDVHGTQMGFWGGAGSAACQEFIT